MCCLTSDFWLAALTLSKPCFDKGLSIMNSNRVRFDHLARIYFDPDGTFYDVPTVSVTPI